MTSDNKSSFGMSNRLLTALPREEYQALCSDLELVRLPKSQVIYDAGETVRQTYFVTSGMVSLLSASDDGATVQVGLRVFPNKRHKCFIGFQLKAS